MKVPEDWNICALDDLCERMSNGANAQQYDEEVGLPISRIETIWNENIDTGRVKYIKETATEFIEKYCLKKGDILFSHINSDLHLGKTAIFNNQFPILIHGINLLLLRLNGKVDPDFLNYQLKYKRKQGHFISIAQKSVNQSSINQKKLKAVQIALPDLKVQQQIVSKIEELFSELDKGVEELKKAQQQLKVYRQAVLKWAFEGKLTNENISDGELPGGWQSASINDILPSDRKAMSTGPFGTILKKHEHQNSGVPVLGIENIGEGVFRMPNKIFVSKSKAVELKNFRVDQNDVIISRSGTVGEICIVPAHMKDALISTNLIKVSLDERKVNPKYFVFMFQGGHVRNQVSNLCKGSSRAFLNQTILSSLEFPYCSLAEQNKIVDEIENRMSVWEKLEETIAISLLQGEVLKQTILKKAFAGELV